MTLRQTVEYGTKVLKEALIDNPSIDAWYLLEYVMHIDKVYYLLNMEEELDHNKQEEYQLLLTKRSQHYPLQYITGVQEFMGFEFFVNESVLIPRQDTETLVEEIINSTKGIHSILDMCTGSGCIAISLDLLLKPELVVGVDISGDALHTAAHNVEHLSSKVNLIQSDLFANVEGHFDLIVSNPPYISTQVCKTLMPEVRDFEPMIALDGEEDGLVFYRKIADEARQFLNDNGYLFFEIGYDQGQSLIDILGQYKEYSQITVTKDLSGMDRIVSARFKLL